MNNIFSAINQFAKFNNMSDAEYYMLNKQKKLGYKLKSKPIEAIQEHKEHSNEVKSKLTKRPKIQQAPPNLKNYQSNTLSIQQKRRSFANQQPEPQGFVLFGSEEQELLMLEQARFKADEMGRATSQLKPRLPIKPPTSVY